MGNFCAEVPDLAEEGEIARGYFGGAESGGHGGADGSAVETVGEGHSDAFGERDSVAKGGEIAGAEMVDDVGLAAGKE